MVFAQNHCCSSQQSGEHTSPVVSLVGSLLFFISSQTFHWCSQFYQCFTLYPTIPGILGSIRNLLGLLSCRTVPQKPVAGSDGGMEMQECSSRCTGFQTPSPLLGNAANFNSKLCLWALTLLNPNLVENKVSSAIFSLFVVTEGTILT